MAYFPAFLSLERKRILLVGGGTIAADKLEKLLDFTDRITIVAIEAGDRVRALAADAGLPIELRPYRSREACDYDIAVIATDTPDLHRQIFEETRDARTLVNSVDDTRYCDFIFPSYLRRGNLTVAFSTSGASPAFARELRRRVERTLPEGVEAFLEEMARLRRELPKGDERMRRFEEMVREFFARAESRKDGEVE
ncbi:precorrin-2 dehydrogenase/sirohydrochlorin ferrochelatase family protein [Nitratifractor sp.]